MTEQIKCSYCDKTQHEVAALVQRQDGNVAICNECISMCFIELSKAAHMRHVYSNNPDQPR